MSECFLLLREVGTTWAPLIAIPTVVAGGVASIWLILSGIKGSITEQSRPKRRVVGAASPQRILRWIGKQPATEERRATVRHIGPHQAEHF
jgi:hypothetical protein